MSWGLSVGSDIVGGGGEFRYSRRGRGGGGVLEEVKEVVIF